MPAVLAKTTEISHEDWLSLRRQGIGSSDAPAVVGLSPWKSALDVWLEKIGQAKEQELDPARARRMKAGLTMEPVIAELFAQETGMKPRRRRAILQHPTYQFMIANLDFCLPGNVPVEVKNVEDRNGEWADGKAPDHYLIQVHHQIIVTGANEGYLVALVNGWDLRIIPVERDKEIERLLIAREAEFWGYVKERTPPPVDSSRLTAETLARMYKAKSGLAINLASSYYPAAQRYLAAKEAAKQAEEEAEAAANELKAAMGEAVIAVIPDPSGGPGVKVSWPEITPEPRFDAKRFAEEHPELYSQYLTPSKPYRRFVVNPIKAR